MRSERVWFEGAAGFAPQSRDECQVSLALTATSPYQPLNENPIQPDFFTVYAQFN